MKTGTDVDGNGSSDQSTQGNGQRRQCTRCLSRYYRKNMTLFVEQDITSSSSLERNDEDDDKDYSSDGASSSGDEALQWFGGLPRGKLESNIDGSKKKTKKSSKDERSTAASSSSSKGKGPVVGQSTPEKKGSKSEKKPKV